MIAVAVLVWVFEALLPVQFSEWFLFLPVVVPVLVVVVIFTVAQFKPWAAVGQFAANALIATPVFILIWIIWNVLKSCWIVCN